MHSEGFCFPDESHPNAAEPIEELARRFAVSVEQVRRWCDRGLAQTADGRIDPFACSNWVSWNCLYEAPALSRLWRQFAAHFRPFVLGADTGRHLQWQRRQQLFLPPSAASFCWSVPDITDDTPWQQARRSSDCLVQGAGTNADVRDCGTYWEITGTGMMPTCAIDYDVDLRPCVPPLAEADERQYLYTTMCTLVESFVYEYRQHAHSDTPHTVHLAAQKQGQRGSCLDISLHAAALFEQHGRGWRLCGGVIAHSTLLNPHYWLEVETASGWVPFDACIPAIMRMLGEDWRLWAQSYCCAVDSGRITLSREAGLWDVPGGNFISASTGAVCVVDASGAQVNGWPCIDWVCGECDGAIRTL